MAGQAAHIETYGDSGNRSNLPGILYSKKTNNWASQNPTQPSHELT